MNKGTVKLPNKVMELPCSPVVRFGWGSCPEGGGIPYETNGDARRLT